MSPPVHPPKAPGWAGRCRSRDFPLPGVLQWVQTPGNRSHRTHTGDRAPAVSPHRSPGTHADVLPSQAAGVSGEVQVPEGGSDGFVIHEGFA